MRISELEKQYLNDALAMQFCSSSGANYMSKLEMAFAARFGASYTISCINGTATMHAALEGMGIGIGDEVIVPPLTMSATTFAVLQCGATPIFADVDPDTFQISAESIRERITSDTKAIITVALYGMCPEMDAVLKICKEFNLFLIEDNAECFLGEYKGKLVGTFGDAASFSFQSSKHLTSGEGGMLILKEEELATKVRRVTSLGYAGVGASKAKITKSDIQHPSYLRHVSMGWNYRMPELCCAVALAQVERIDELVGYRISSANLMAEVISNFTWLVPQYCPDHIKNSYWTYVVKNDSTLSWDDLHKAVLSAGGDGFYGAWQLTYLEPMFKKMTLLGREKLISSSVLVNYKEGSCPVAENLQPLLMQLPTNYWDSDSAQKQADSLYKAFKQLAG